VGYVVGILDVVLGGLLISAALAKVLDMRRWREALFGYRLAYLRSRPLAVALPAAEALIGILLLLDRNPAAAATASVLFGVFALVLIQARRGGATGQCGCLGGIFESSIGPGAVMRAAALAVASGLLAAFSISAASPPGLSLIGIAFAAGLLVAGQARIALQRMPYQDVASQS
jgi:hypothetical protein